jgi:DNA polymerase III subunit delta'
MNAPATFREFVGNTRVVEILRCAVAQNRLPHALVFAGPSGVGKHTLARLLAQMLNCLADEETRPCGACQSCRKIQRELHPDIHELAPDGTFIKIDQIRNLILQLAYKPFEGRYHVAILDQAEQMQKFAANSLLKTLEEPASPSVLVLVTTNPHALLGTILSRARILTFGGVSEDEIVRFLVTKCGRKENEARAAALLSNGSLGAAERFDPEAYGSTRTVALQFVERLLRRRDFAGVSSIAANLHKDKDQERFLLWADIVALVLQDVYYARHAPTRMTQEDIRADLERLAAAVPGETVAAAVRGFREFRSILNRTKINRQMALEALYLSLEQRTA